MVPRKLILLFFFALLGINCGAQVLTIFDDNPENGLAYDASDIKVTAPSSLRRDGFSTNKIPLITTNVYRGRHAALLEYTSKAGGDWRVQLSSPHWALRPMPQSGSLVFYVNAPKAVRASSLPRISLAWESNKQTPPASLSQRLPDGVDADPTTWQQVRIPLQELHEDATAERLRGVTFSQRAEVEAGHQQVYIDYLHLRPETKGAPPEVPRDLKALAGDNVVNLYWDKPTNAVVDEYRVYRRQAAQGEWQPIALSPVEYEAFADVAATNGISFEYRVTALNLGGESLPSEAVLAAPKVFASDTEFLDYLQQTGFWYFWQQANPTNGIVRDRSHPNSFSSIAATGFGLTAIGIAIEREWITREAGCARVLATLKTFANGPQGSAARHRIGHRGWFYHFLEMESATRFANSELSSIDTTLLLGGIVFAREYFNGSQDVEREIRALADKIFGRIDWRWMTNGKDSLTMGWHPETGFIKSRWIGYDEAMLTYVLALGAAPNKALEPKSWRAWTSGYEWKTSYGLSYVHFEPLFGHQYSHCWIDFRNIADDYMRRKKSDYFENSHRAALAQQRYAMANPNGHKGYGEFMWGFTACDGPGYGGVAPYMARGAPPALNDDGTIAPTAPGGSIPFAPQICIPTLRNIYNTQRASLWGPYGFNDAFNLNVGWADAEALGIDQGPIVLMIENHRTGLVWKIFMKSPIIQKGLKRAGFKPAR